MKPFTSSCAALALASVLSVSTCRSSQKSRSLAALTPPSLSKTRNGVGLRPFVSSSVPSTQETFLLTIFAIFALREQGLKPLEVVHLDPSHYVALWTSSLRRSRRRRGGS